MSGIIKQTVTVELTDGRVFGPERIIHADKIALEKTARARNWDVEKNFATTNAFLGWAALKRTGGAVVGGFEEFLDDLVDVAVERGEPVDPTQADH